MTQRLFNLARMTVSSSGVGVVTLNSAVSGFATFAQTGVPAAGTVSYAISDTNQSEIGVGIYSSGGGLTLGATGGGATRTPIMNHTGTSSAIDMSNAAQIFITPNVRDWPWLLDVAGTTAVMIIGGTEMMRFDSTTTSLIIGYPASASGKRVQIHGVISNESSWLDIINWGGVTGNAAVSTTRKSGSGVIGTHAILANNEFVSDITQMGSDGVTFGELSCVRTYADAASSVGSTPGRLTFWTTPSAALVALERLRIDRNGLFTIGGTANQTGSRFEINGTSAGSGQIYCARWDAASANSIAIVQGKSRSGTIGSHTIVQNNDGLALWWAQGSDGAAFQTATQIITQVDGAPGVGSMPGRLMFQTTPTGTVTSVERMRIAAAGNIYVIGASTTASAANTFINNASTPANELLRVTSSLRYKTKVTDIPPSRIKAIRKLRPIEYSSLAKSDNRKTRFVGYAAEEVEKIDPALVNHDALGRPDSVMYDRILLMKIADLQATVAKLEAKLGV